MIDIHTHIGYVHNSANAFANAPLTAEGLVAMMDRDGIERAAVLPIVSPETTAMYTSVPEVISACGAFPDRLIPFANIDPRSCGNIPEADFRWLLARYRDEGCRGIGEVTANLPFEDPRVMNFLGQCGEYGLPVTLHLTPTAGGEYGLIDTLGLPGLEHALRQLPQTVFLGHSPTFWREISGDVGEGGLPYAGGAIARQGRIQTLLEAYPNLYGDLSANSGFNALNRDHAYARTFLEHYQDRLLFGTDYLGTHVPVPIITFLKEIGISAAAYRKITVDNARKLLKI